MTLELIRQQVELNKKIYMNLKSSLWKMKDKKIDGSKKSWDLLNNSHSSKIKLLNEILEYIDEGSISVNNEFVNNQK